MKKGNFARNYMKLKFNIGTKIGLGFGILILFTILVFAITNKTLNESKAINDEIINLHNPSLAALEELKSLTYRSKLLIYTWVYTPRSLEDDPDKKKLINLQNKEYPYIKTRLKTLYYLWPEEEQKILQDIFISFDELWQLHEEIRNYLPDFESYNDPQNRFLAQIEVESGGRVYEKTDEILFQLDDLIKRQKLRSETMTESMIASFERLQFLFRYLGVGLVIFGIIIAFYVTRSIVKPVFKLKNVILNLSKGIYPDQPITAPNDEIGEMANAIDTLIQALKKTKEFAEKVGSGDFTAEYTPLSEYDDLGYALLKMRDDLKQNEEELERKVIERTAEVVRQKEELEKQSKKIEELYREVTSSIRYARRLQEAILPPGNVLKKLLKNYFIFYKPKDIVSGDFYWVSERNGCVYAAAVDCTGHGVPGAFMSIVGYNNLNQTIEELDGGSPAEILTELNKLITEALHQKDGDTRDGMDMSLVKIDRKNKTIEFAGANNPLYLVRNKHLTEFKGDKYAIGSYYEKETKIFTNHQFKFEEGDMLYLFTDGFADQFGGAKGKKIMYKNFRNLIIEVSDKDCDQQRILIEQYFNNWKGNLDQVDDVLVMGIRC